MDRCVTNLGSTELACGSQAFIATLLFDPSMSALPIIEVAEDPKCRIVHPLIRERELGLDRRETG